MTKKEPQTLEISGLGSSPIGRDLLRNMANQGFSVAGFDTDLSKIEALGRESKKERVDSEASSPQKIE